MLFPAPKINEHLSLTRIRQSDVVVLASGDKMHGATLAAADGLAFAPWAVRESVSRLAC